MNERGILVVVSGFSGAGKGTLMKHLLEKYDYSLSISMTTRNPRVGEVEGKDYFFVTTDEFEACIAEEGFIEYANYCNNYYGTPKKYVEQELEAGHDVILEIEAQGALQVKNKFKEALLVFVLTPDVNTLFTRLNGRGTENQEQIDRRLHRAAEEVDLINDYDAVIVNDDLEAATDRLHGIIQAAKAATFRNKEFTEGFREQFAELFKGGEK